VAHDTRLFLVRSMAGIAIAIKMNHGSATTYSGRSCQGKQYQYLSPYCQVNCCRQCCMHADNFN